MRRTRGSVELACLGVNVLRTEIFPLRFETIAIYRRQGRATVVSRGKRTSLERSPASFSQRYLCGRGLVQYSRINGPIEFEVAAGDRGRSGDLRWRSAGDRCSDCLRGM